VPPVAGAFQLGNVAAADGLCYPVGMADLKQTNFSDDGDQPGKTRTMWHPLLVRLLNYTLASAYTVVEEVSVGKIPLRIDVLLIRREDGKLADSRSLELSALLPLLNCFTLVEFKGPTDAVERGDFAKLVGCAYLWHGQEKEIVPHKDLSLVFLLPTFCKPIQDEIQALGFQASAHEPGIFRVDGLPFSTWLVETDVMAEQGEPVLSLVSRAFLNDRHSIIERLAGQGYGALAQYRFMVQEVQQFRNEEDFAMQQALSEHLDQFTEELVTKMLEELPAERRLRGLPAEDLLRGLPAEEVLRDEELVTKMLEELPAERRLRGLPAEERVRGLSVEELLSSLTVEQAARLRELFARK
jgi:hypothetical protein